MRRIGRRRHAGPGLQYGAIGPAQDPHQFGINPQLFGMTQGDVNQSFEDIRTRAAAVQSVLRVQRNELRDMDVLDWQGKMLDWRPMLLWGMLLDPFDRARLWHGGDGAQLQGAARGL